MEKEINMYSNMFQPRALVALGVFLVFGTGCAEFKKTGEAGEPRSRANTTTHAAIPTESIDITGPLLDRISQLERDLAAEKRDSAWHVRETERLKTNCGEGFMRDGSSRFQVSTADSPETVNAAVNAVYASQNMETYNPAQLTVKNVKLSTGKGWPDIVCFTFDRVDGRDLGRTCFDPMEITER